MRPVLTDREGDHADAGNRSRNEVGAVDSPAPISSAPPAAVRVSILIVVSGGPPTPFSMIPGHIMHSLTFRTGYVMASSGWTILGQYRIMLLNAFLCKNASRSN